MEIGRTGFEDIEMIDGTETAGPQEQRIGKAEKFEVFVAEVGIVGD